MKKITHKTVLSKRSLKPKRCFFDTESGLTTDEYGDSGQFHVKFPESIKLIFEKQTGLCIHHDPIFGQYYCEINTDEELITIKSWEKKQGSLVFLRDCLSISLALDENYNHNVGQKTEIGKLEYEGKHHQDTIAIQQLADMVEEKINGLPFYKDANFICSVPSYKSSDFDLPSSVTSLVSNKIGIQDITKGFVFSKQKSSLKELPLDQKWNGWEDAKISFNNNSAINIEEKTVILIDDKYQSGTTIQYIAMKLQEAGAREVYGLCFVKTMNDTDNVSGSKINV